MAHALQKEVVAEGVENVDQLKLLKQLGCERGQGYLFGKPVPADSIQRIFRAAVQPGQLAQATAPAEPARDDAARDEAARDEPAALERAPRAEPAAERAAAADNRGEPATVPLPLADFEELVRVNLPRGA